MFLKAFTRFGSVNQKNEPEVVEETKDNPEDLYRELNNSFAKNETSIKELNTELNDKENILAAKRHRSKSLEWALDQAQNKHNMPETHPVVVQSKIEKEDIDNEIVILQPEVNRLREVYNVRLSRHAKMNTKMNDLRGKIDLYLARKETAEDTIAFNSLANQFEDLQKDVYAAEALAEISTNEKEEDINDEFKRLGIERS